MEEILNEIAILFEGKNNDQKELISFIVLFYEHTAKWKFVPNKQTISWLNTIYRSSDFVRSKQKSRSLYLGFNMKEELNKINEHIVTRLVKQNNDMTKFNLIEIYDYFPTLDDIGDRNKVNNFLAKHLRNYNIHLR